MDYMLFFFVAPAIIGVLFLPIVISVIRRVRGGSSSNPHDPWRDDGP